MHTPRVVTETGLTHLHPLRSSDVLCGVTNPGLRGKQCPVLDRMGCYCRECSHHRPAGSSSSAPHTWISSSYIFILRSLLVLDLRPRNTVDICWRVGEGGGNTKTDIHQSLSSWNFKHHPLMSPGSFCCPLRGCSTCPGPWWPLLKQPLSSAQVHDTTLLRQELIFPV